MTQQVSESFKKRESLRCLFASVASMEVIDWLLEGGQLKAITANAYDIDERLTNIRSFFLSGWGLTRQEVERKFIPLGSLLAQHIYGVLFADAVRWWAAAHRSKQDRNKYLRYKMYKGGFVALYDHFLHGFRNNQLAHFPGGQKSNDNPLLTPAPYGFFLTPKEVDDFRALLAYSIKLIMRDGDPYQDTWDEFVASAGEEFDHIPDDQKEALQYVFRRLLNDLDKELLKIPIRNYFPEADQDGNASGQQDKEPNSAS